MNELIKITEQNGKQVVSDAELTRLEFNVLDSAYLFGCGRVEGKEFYTLKEVNRIIQYSIFKSKIDVYNYNNSTYIDVGDFFEKDHFILFSLKNMPNDIRIKLLVFENDGRSLSQFPYYISYNNVYYINPILLDVVFNFELKSNQSFRRVEHKDTEVKSSCKKTYIMHDSTFNAYKIGRSINPKKREKTLGVQFPRITLFAVYNDDIELYLHKKYKHKRLRGEWFDLNNNDLKDIMKIGFKTI